MATPRKAPMPVCRVMCPTCPFRDGNKTDFKNVRRMLSDRALKEGSTICHSTGSAALVPRGKRTPSHEMLCRGARNLQLSIFHGLGFLAEPTDAAWNAKVAEMEPRKRRA